MKVINAGEDTRVELDSFPTPARVFAKERPSLKIPRRFLDRDENGRGGIFREFRCTIRTEDTGHRNIDKVSILFVPAACRK